MNITDLWLQLQELEQELRDAKSEASRSHDVLRADLHLMKTKLNVDYLAQNQRLEALIKRVKTLKGATSFMAYRARPLVSDSPETPTQAEAPSEDTLGGGQVQI